MVVKTPSKLFVCVFKVKQSYAEALDKIYQDNLPLPPETAAIREGHTQYTRGLMENKILWMGGHSPEFFGMNILAVDSLEEAKKIQESDPCYINGFFYDVIVFEYIVHIPMELASPAFLERIEKDKKAGRIKPKK
jgi:uncharacterized protein YciI